MSRLTKLDLTIPKYYPKWSLPTWVILDPRKVHHTRVFLGYRNPRIPQIGQPKNTPRIPQIGQPKNTPRIPQYGRFSVCGIRPVNLGFSVSVNFDFDVFNVIIYDEIIILK